MKLYELLFWCVYCLARVKSHTCIENNTKLFSVGRRGNLVTAYNRVIENCLKLEIQKNAIKLGILLILKRLGGENMY